MLIEFHRRMLADKVRSAAFEAALRQVIRPGETTVADIGAGTGVLGLMARRLGAREVHLIEHGLVLELARRLAAANGYDGIQFWPADSGEIIDPPQVDVVVAEILGNLALEENALETLADARRFLKAGGTVIPRSIEQFVTPVTTDRFWRDLRSWDEAPLGLNFSAARAASCDNLYVHRLSAADLLVQENASQRWDALEFTATAIGQRHGAARWELRNPARIFGFALWWTCELVPGIALTTSPFGEPTHWDQVYAPIEYAIDGDAADVIELTIDSETGGGEAGIGMRWRATHLRGTRVISQQTQDIGRGFVG